MGKPLNPTDDVIHDVMHEIISAMSSLNMEPELIKDPKGFYLSDTDKWANHAMEHLQSAFDRLHKFSQTEEYRKILHGKLY